MKVFISYSTAIDQIIALRLQTMAAVYGMTVYVPPATTRYQTTGVLLPEVQRELNESAVVLAVITHSPVPSALSEMEFAVGSGRLLIPIVSQAVPLQYYANFQPYFVVDPLDPSPTVNEIVRFLAGKKQQTEMKGNLALVALATLAIALLMFSGQSD